LENELRGLLRIFGIKLPRKMSHGQFDEVVRESIEADQTLIRALLPLLDLRKSLCSAYVKLDKAEFS